MRMISIPAAALAVFGAIEIACAGGSPVTIVTIEPNPANPSGRLRIDGSGFGESDAGGEVVINGLGAFVTEWTSNTIVAYVPEAISAGEATVEIMINDSVADSFVIQIVPREQVGQMKWRFAVDASYMNGRPGTGPDGSVHMNDVEGRLYKLSSDGGLQWIVDALRGQTGLGAEGPTVVGDDGTIYVAVNPLGPTTDLVAFNPDGTLKWEFIEPDSFGVAVGPAVGPDGNVYVAFHDADQSSFGICSFTPDGRLRWNNNGSPPLYEHGAIGAELAFGPSSNGGPVDQVVLTVDRDDDGHLYAFDMGDGNQNWATPRGVVESIFMQFQMEAESGPDGTVYMTEFTGLGGLGWGLKAFDRATGEELWRWDPNIISNISAPVTGSDGIIYISWDISRVGAVSPDAETLWTHVDFGGILTGPIVSPDNSVVMVGGGEFGQPGFFKLIDAATGDELWKYDLTSENGGNIVPDARALFTPDSATAYFPASIPALPEAFRYCYLYALEIDVVETDLDNDGVVDSNDNCPDAANPGQDDGDADGLGDACDFNSDLCIAAVAICPGTLEGSTFGATNDGLSSCSPFANLNKDVWFSYTPQDSGSVTINTCNSAYTNYLSVHSGCPGTAANQIACASSGCSIFPSVTFSVDAGSTYLIRVNGYAANEIEFTLNLSGPDCGPVAPRGDLNGDGVVGPADLAELLASWGSCSSCPADLNGDGTVGPADLGELLANWG